MARLCWVFNAVRVLSGVVTTLGRGGFRFQPNNRESFELALIALRENGAAAELADAVLPARISTIFDAFAHFRFDTVLSVAEQKTILKASTVTPQFVRAYGRDDDLSGHRR